MQKNFLRMLDLVNEVFDVRHDPDQLDVSESVREKLLLLHPNTMSEQSNEDGPIAWILLIPTTKDVMNCFVSAQITEKQLFEETRPGDDFSAIYLCSACVLPEFRGQGIAKELTLNAVEKMQQAYHIEALYFWKFSDDGERLAKALGVQQNLPVYVRV